MLSVGLVRDIPERVINIEPHVVSADKLDSRYKVVGTLTITDMFDWSSTGLQTGDLVVNATTSTLLEVFHMWRPNELRELAHAHEIRLRARESKSALLDIVNMHMWNGTKVSGPRSNTSFIINLPQNLTTATMRRLTAPNGAPSHKNVTFGGIQWEYETKGEPKRKDGVVGSSNLTIGRDGTLDVEVPASEAVLIELA